MVRIETERLILRQPEQEDLDGWAAFMEDEESTRFIGGTMPRSATWRVMAAFAGSWSLKGFGMFSVIEKETGKWVGRLGPWQPEGWPGPEIGWGLARSAWGKGYALEGSTAAMDWAFKELGWTEVIHTIHPDNVASWKLAERLGSFHQGPGKLPAPFEHLEVEVRGQSRADWERRAR